MHDRDGWIWYDGKLEPWRSATTHVLTHSLHYGLSVIEGVRAYRSRAGGSAVFRLREHTRRFLDSAHVYRMPLPFSAETLEQAQLEVLRVNQLEAAYIRPIAFYGSEKLGVSPIGNEVHVAIAAWPWASYFEGSSVERGLSVKTSSFPRLPVGAAPPRAKVAAYYTNAILARMEAVEDGYDEALMLDVSGYVAEGPGENIFVVKNGKLYEPEPTSALSGITRDTVIELARALGIACERYRLTRDDVYLADEAFFTGTAAEIAAIAELDHRRIGDGNLGPVTRRLREAYLGVVRGDDPERRAWLTPVPA
jgi:branched-chain amino acid aminotransferase